MSDRQIWKSFQEFAKNQNCSIIYIVYLSNMNGELYALI